MFSFRAGSLVVKYSVQLPADTKACVDTSSNECLKNVAKSVKNTSASETINTGEMSGEISNEKTTVTGIKLVKNKTCTAT